MIAKRKPAIRAKKVIHDCNQQDAISHLVDSNQKLSEILTGNSHPKEGLFYRFNEFMFDHKIVVDNIKEIKEGVAGLHKRADDNKDAAATAQRAIEIFKLETESFDKGAKDREAKEAIANALAAQKEQNEKDKKAVALALEVQNKTYRETRNWNYVVNALTIIGIAAAIWLGLRGSKASINNEDQLKAIKSEMSNTGVTRGAYSLPKTIYEIRKDSLMADSLSKIKR
jgi:hypothetical protein